MFVCCVHPVAVLNAVFCMTCNLLMLVEDAKDHHMEEACSIAGLLTALYVTKSVSFCLPHPVAVSTFMFCRYGCIYCLAALVFGCDGGLNGRCLNVWFLYVV